MMTHVANAFDHAERADLARALFEELGDALFLVDPDSYQILDANPTAQRLSGFSHEQLLRMEATYLFRSQEKGGRQRLQQASRKTGIFHSQDGFLLRPDRDGLWVPTNLAVSRLHD